MDIPAALLDRVHQLAAELPAAEVRQLVAALAAAPPGQWPAIRLQAQRALPGGAARDLAGRLVQDWHTLAPALSPADVGLMLTTAGHGVAAVRRQTLELVWTGPDSPSPLRRTDQVLLQLIDEAVHDVLRSTLYNGLSSSRLHHPRQLRPRDGYLLCRLQRPSE